MRPGQHRQAVLGIYSPVAADTLRGHLTTKSYKVHDLLSYRAWILSSSLVQDFCSLCVVPEAEKAQESSVMGSSLSTDICVIPAKGAHLSNGEAEQRVLTLCYMPAFHLYLPSPCGLL